MKIVTNWVGKREFETKFAHHTILLDGSKQRGFGPKSLLLSGLAGCSGIDVVDILEKMRVEIEDLSMEVETSITEEHPKVFKEILITYTVKADPANEDKIRKAIELSLDKYCGVSAMLKKNSPIEYKLVINP